MEKARIQQREDENSIEYPSSDREQLETLSHDEMKIMMGFVENLGGVAQEILVGPLEIDMRELRIRGLAAQADILESDFERSGAVESIEKVVDCRSQALSLTSDRHPGRACRLATLGVSLNRKFARLGDLGDINNAIQLLSQAMLHTPEGDVNRKTLINNLGLSYQCRFDRLGELADMNKAIELLSQTVLLTPDDDPDKPRGLSNLGGSYVCRFERLGELSDIDESIKLLSQAVLLTPDGHAEKPTRYNNLGISYQCRFEHLGELSDIDKAIECKIRAVLLTPDGHSAKPRWQSNLGNSYLFRFAHLGELADIDKAIETLTQAVSLTPDGHTEKLAMQNNLGTSYESRFGRLGELADIDKAVEYLSQAVLHTPDDHAEKPGMHNNLGMSYQCRFQRLGELEDINKSIECLSQAVLTTPDGHALKPGRHDNLGNSYQYRFQHLGELADIDKAIECQRQAVLLTPDGHAKKLKMYNNLGVSYQGRFQRLGELADIDKSIECLSQAVLLTPDGHADKPDRYNNLGSAYQRRFERLGEVADIDKSIQSLSQAVLLTPDGHAGKPALHSNIGCSYLSRFDRLGERSDIDMAIQYQSKAVLLTPDDHASKPTFHSNIGCSYQSRFERLGELADIDKAIESLSQAVLVTPDGHADKPGRQNNLGGSYQRRFERLGEAADIEKAIEYRRQALLLTPDGHAYKSSRLKNIANSYLHRFELLGERSDLESAQSHFQRGAQLHNMDPVAQIGCARGWAKTSALLGLPPQLSYERCMELVPHLIWLGATIDERYTKLPSIGDLATEAAAWAISVGQYDLAIEWLEQGRSVVWSQILQLRTPFDGLSTADSSLASDLQRIASELSASSTRPEPLARSTSPSLDNEKEAQQHRRLAEEWECLVEQARSIPGFEGFLMPPKAAELKMAAKDGPIVLINTHSTRWDALVIFPQCDEIVHIPLVELHTNEASKSLAQLNPASVAGQRGEALRKFTPVNQGRKPEDPLKTMLVALWEGVVEPILNALACTCKLSTGELPHVTWCATGQLAFAPLHAAGPYDGSSPNTFDLVISSYTPSLSALCASSAPVIQPAAGVLAVGQEYTRGFCPLPNTVRELAAVKQHTQATRFLQLDGKDATIHAVLDAMDKHSCVHLACHATQNPANPAHSAFHLYNGNLTLEAITKRQFKNKGLAFLSACQTAQGDEKLPDEAVHLAAGMLMAGYPSVIATMWPIFDADGPVVAGRVYAELLKEGNMDHTQAARALHMAIAELREKSGVDSFKRWVPFIHIGV